MKRLAGLLPFFAGAAITLLLGWSAFPSALYFSREQPLRFSHLTHTGEDVGMECADCHAIEAASRLALIPELAVCADCHTEPLGESEDEATLIEDYITAGRVIPWHIYSKQPDHVHFSHATHVLVGEIECEQCHGDHGKTENLQPYEENRLTGYSRLIWGHSAARTGRQPWEGKKMGDCARCHEEQDVVESCMDCHK